MAFSPSSSSDTTWWLFTLPAITGTHHYSHDTFLLFFVPLLLFLLGFLSWTFSSGGLAWKNGRTILGRVAIPGPRGVPIFGSLFSLSYGLAHRTLASLANSLAAKQLMAFSLGSVPAAITSDPHIAREILTSPHFADRPVKQSAKTLMFSRAIGFAPNGSYWRLLRRIASAHLFSPRRIAAHETGRLLDCSTMLRAIAAEQSENGVVALRKHLQAAALNNIMGTVFGKRYAYNYPHSFDLEVKELHEIVREGFELLGAFNWCDYVPWMSLFYDPSGIKERCRDLVPRVRKFVKGLIDEHRLAASSSSNKLCDSSDFVDVLLSLDEPDEKLHEDDMIAVLWEMIFRGTDTTALLTEWAMAELVLNGHVQARLREEVDEVVGDKDDVTDSDVAKMPYLQAVMKETLRVHPPGPLLSWARLSTSDVQLSNGMVVPAHTTTMVNMWAITHDPEVWDDPLAFKPERFVPSEGGADVDVRGVDLRLAPFGAGRRVCPGKNLGLVTVNLWVAKLVRQFEWIEGQANPVDLTEQLNLSCEMKNPLKAVAIPRAI
ncbi:cytochrome P450 78A7-like [Neltuma alba]|uniref:cytochrome P450 78A7-like n=1 Tax=Neltuma alba TaxID=207710 RepID=UPI0010A3C918|nr:cytochrome P450 78A7-like [Prosopis alba]XP_028772195.1 cytochrome P450 78A7-like [Prosopis alba]